MTTSPSADVRLVPARVGWWWCVVDPGDIGWSLTYRRALRAAARRGSVTARAAEDAAAFAAARDLRHQDPLPRRSPRRTV